MKDPSLILTECMEMAHDWPGQSRRVWALQAFPSGPRIRPFHIQVLTSLKFSDQGVAFHGGPRRGDSAMVVTAHCGVRERLFVRVLFSGTLKLEHDGAGQRLFGRLRC